MQINKINSLIKKIKEMRIELCEIKENLINELSNQLNVVLSEDYKLLSQKYNYEYFPPIFEWCGFPDGIIKYTKELRERGLPHKYVILADNGDGGWILMETKDSPEKSSPIIWCDYYDIFNLCEKGAFDSQGIPEYELITWPSFTDFFEYLIERYKKEWCNDES